MKNNTNYTIQKLKRSTVSITEIANGNGINYATEFTLWRTERNGIMAHLAITGKSDQEKQKHFKLIYRLMNIYDYNLYFIKAHLRLNLNQLSYTHFTSFHQNHTSFKHIK